MSLETWSAELSSARSCAPHSPRIELACWDAAPGGYLGELAHVLRQRNKESERTNRDRAEWSSQYKYRYEFSTHLQYSNKQGDTV